MKENGSQSQNIKVDAPGRSFFWFLMLAGILLIAYFSLNMVVNFIYAVDLAGDGIQVVLEDAVVEGGQVVEEADVIILRGMSGWVESFAPWLAVNASTMFLGAFIFALGYMMTGRRKERVAVSLFKMRMLGSYMALLALIILILGMDRVFFIPHGARPTFLSWFDWYVMEFLAHIIWAVLLAVLSCFFLRVKEVDDRQTGKAVEQP